MASACSGELDTGSPRRPCGTKRLALVPGVIDYAMNL